MMRFPRVALAAAATMIALPLVGCAPQSTPAPPSEPAPTAQPTPEPTESPVPEPPAHRRPTTGLAAPWSVVFVGSTPLVSERDSGRILELAPDGSARRVATVTGVSFGGEGGVLGLALLSTPSSGDSPSSGATSGQIDPATGAVAPGSYLYVYSTGSTGNRVQRFPLTGRPGALSLGRAHTIIDRLPSAANHNGGRIAFGPDGMLYATVGDASQPSRAQDLGSLGGKILRLTPKGGIPNDNPFPDSPVYSYGHRNPQGISWAEDGTMFASEFGQDTWDELNVIKAGANYGWPTVEGIAGDGRFTDPVQQWRTAAASPSGIAIADGRIYIANLRGQRLRAVPLSDLTRSRSYFVGAYGRLRDVILAPDGTLWALTNNTDGRGEPRSGDDRFIDTGLL